MRFDLTKSVNICTHLPTLLPAALRNFTFSIFAGLDTAKRKIHAVNLMVLGFVLFTLSLIIAFYVLLPFHPNGKEIAFSLFISFGYWMNFALIVSAGCAVVSLVVPQLVRFTLEVIDEQKKQSQLLPSLSLHPDISVFSLSETEDAASREERFNEARKNRKPGQYVVCVFFRKPSGLIIADKDDGVFERRNPPYQETWPKESHLQVPPNHLYTAETWDEYEQDLLTLCQYLPEYLSTIRLDVPNPGNALAAELKMKQ